MATVDFRSGTVTSMSESEMEDAVLRLQARFREPYGEGRSISILSDSDDSDSEEEKEMVNLRKKSFRVKSNNGYVFNKKYSFPEEVLSLILSYLEPQDLVFNCRRVCKNWCNVIDSHVWKLQLERNNFQIAKTHDLKWVYYYWILSKKDLFNRNLVKNACGEEELEHWEDYKDLWAAISWEIEKPPIGCEDLPQEMGNEILKHNSCFATRDWYKTQYVDLKNLGITREFLLIVKPKITVSEWYCGRYDYSSKYNFDARLVNSDYKERFGHFFGSDPDDDDEEFTGLFAAYQFCNKIGGENGSYWLKVSHVFEQYSEKIERIKIEHAGMEELRSGCFGCKVTGTSVVLSLT